MNLNDVHVFLMVSSSGSLTQAAKRLEISAMAASRRLASLEQELGTRLVHRTTRSTSLTPEGEDFLPYAKAMVEAEESAKFLFSPNPKGASGLLRVTSPSGIGRRNVMPLIKPLLEQNPELRVELQLHDDVLDIVGRGIDVAIRVAPLRDSTLIAKRIVNNARVVCASPEYLALHGMPSSLEDLHRHSCIRLLNVPQWTFIADGQPTVVSVEGRVSCNNVDSVRELCMEGMGLAQLTLMDVKREFNSGALVEVVLDNVTPQDLSVWALLPTNKNLPPRVTLFIEHLRAAMEQE
jgi:DNA-binding transcriptional LysR family regulator